MRHVRHASLVIAAAVLAASCGGGALSAAEYADTLQDKVWEMNRGIDAAHERHDASPITIESERELWHERVELRDHFSDEMRAITPPPAYADMHAGALEVIGRLLTAERAVAAEADSAVDIGDVIALREGQAMATLAAADNEAIALCRSAEAALDTSSDQRLDAGIPWVTPAVGEVVRVVFGCTADERGD